jgi:glycosyltransferase involved in cell wall biosynthesis
MTSIHRKSLLTVTIGIPAYNEEANISYLLDDILRQKEEGFVIEKILIISDGSSDRTAELARSVSDPRIEVVEYPERQGKMARQNAMLKTVSSDVVVLLDADIALSGNYFLTEIIRPIIENQADLVGAQIITLPAQNFIEKILESGMRLKALLFEKYRAGRNVYTCTGRARALSRRFYSQLHFPNKTGEDAYSYFACLTGGFTYAYAKNAVVMIKLPENLADHTLQSERFFSSQKQFYDDFGKDVIKREYRLPHCSAVKMFFTGGIKFSFYLFVYCVIVMVIRSQSLRRSASSGLWEISTSSKNLQRDKLNSQY